MARVLPLYAKQRPDQFGATIEYLRENVSYQP